MNPVMPGGGGPFRAPKNVSTATSGSWRVQGAPYYLSHGVEEGLPSAGYGDLLINQGLAALSAGCA